MWCPDGYRRWDEFRENCREAARNFLVRRYGVLKDREERAQADPSVEGPYARKEKEHALANFLVYGALMQGILSCSSASGHPVRIETKNFVPLVFSDDLATKEIFCSDSFPWQPTDWYEAPPAWWKVWERPLYLFIDDKTGTILSPSEAALKNFEEKFTAQYDYAGHGVPDTPVTREDLKGWLHNALADARALAAQFEGQALCIRTDAADRFTGSAFNEFSGDDNLAARQSRGRPRKQEQVRAAYQELYPKGHGSLSKKKVLAEIEMRLGKSVSRPTLDRALKQLGQHPDQKTAQK